MRNIHLFCVGKLKEPYFSAACQEYSKRLGPFCDLRILEFGEERLPQDPSPAQIAGALAKEAAAIRAKLPPSPVLIPLCIEGKTCSSEDFSLLLDRCFQGGAKHLVFLIGGSHGLDEGLKREGLRRLSMSPMTFPHHLARVMLLEQIYRGFQICAGTKYHK